MMRVVSKVFITALVSFCHSRGTAQTDDTLKASRISRGDTIAPFDTSKSASNDTSIRPDIEIQEVSIRIKRKAITVKGDTTEFAVPQFCESRDEVMSDVFARIPGLTVSADGQASYRGTPIDGFKINQSNYGTQDGLLALGSITAADIRSIQIIRDFGDEASLTGVKRGEPKLILNINQDDITKRLLVGTLNGSASYDSSFLLAGSAGIIRNRNQVRAIGHLNSLPFANLGLATHSTFVSRPVVSQNGIRNRNAKHAEISLNRALGKAYYVECGVKGTDAGNENEHVSARYSVNPSLDVAERKESFATYIRQNVVGYVDLESKTLKNITRISLKGSVNSNFIDADASQISRNGKKFTNSVASTNTQNRSQLCSVGLSTVHKFKSKQALALRVRSGFETEREDVTIASEYELRDDSENSSAWPLKKSSTIQCRSQQNNSKQFDGRLELTQPIGSRAASLQFEVASTSIIDNSYAFQESSSLDSTILTVANGIHSAIKTGVHNGRISLIKASPVFSYVLTIIPQYNFLLHSYPSYISGSDTIFKYGVFNFIPESEIRRSFRGGDWIEARVKYGINMPTPRQLLPIEDQSQIGRRIIGNPNLKPERNVDIISSYSTSRAHPRNILSVRVNLGLKTNRIALFVTELSNNSIVQRFENANSSQALNLNASYTFSNEKKVKCFANGNVLLMRDNFNELLYNTVVITNIYSASAGLALQPVKSVTIDARSNCAISFTESQAVSFMKSRQIVADYLLTVSYATRKRVSSKIVFGQQFVSSDLHNAANNCLINANVSYHILPSGRLLVGVDGLNLMGGGNSVSRYLDGTFQVETYYRPIPRQLLLSLYARL